MGGVGDMQLRIVEIGTLIKEGIAIIFACAQVTLAALTRRPLSTARSAIPCKVFAKPANAGYQLLASEAEILATMADTLPGVCHAEVVLRDAALQLPVEIRIVEDQFIRPRPLRGRHYIMGLIVTSETALKTQLR